MTSNVSSFYTRFSNTFAYFSNCAIHFIPLIITVVHLLCLCPHSHTSNRGSSSSVTPANHTSQLRDISLPLASPTKKSKTSLMTGLVSLESLIVLGKMYASVVWINKSLEKPAHVFCNPCIHYHHGQTLKPAQRWKVLYILLLICF